MHAMKLYRWHIQDMRIVSKYLYEYLVYDVTYSEHSSAPDDTILCIKFEW